MKTVFKVLIMVLILLLPIHQMSAQQAQPGSSKRVEIERLFMHRVGEFSAVVLSPSGELNFIHLNNYPYGAGFGLRKNVRILTDVPSDKKMYVEFRNFIYSGLSPYYEMVVVHIRAAEDINGAGYEVRHRKGRREQVQTTVVK